MICFKLQQKIKVSKKSIAECVGLWLAEGDTKCQNEITFTNNELGLIIKFHSTLMQVFSPYSFNTRIYVYTPNNDNIRIPIKVDVIRYYKDKRANKPYFIWRLASVKIHKEWMKLVNSIKRDPTLYKYLLRGIFAGEGNIKTGSHNNRTLRIAQLEDSLFEKILNFLKIKYSYSPRERSYIITSKNNWDIFAQNKLADLHQIKKKKFWSSYSQ